MNRFSLAEILIRNVFACTDLRDLILISLVSQLASFLSHSKFNSPSYRDIPYFYLRSSKDSKYRVP